jgi:flagellar motor switch protein FliG
MNDISIEFAELIKTLSDDLIENIFNKFDKTMVAIALKTIDPKISGEIFKNLSKNDEKEIKNKMVGAVRIEEIETAQKIIIDIINKKNIV